MLNFKNTAANPSSANLSNNNPSRITAYDHVGIRVTDRKRSLSFYKSLGFVETSTFPEFDANEMETPYGVRINLIFNGTKREGNKNILLDEAVKLPGITHPAFVVDNLKALMDWFDSHSINITEGPKCIGPRRRAIFIRDPDGNVLEFNELL